MSQACSRETIAQIRSDLEEVARLLREAGHLEPEAQRTLADLLDELKDELDSGLSHTTHVANLAQIVTRLAQALHERHHPGILKGLRVRLDEAVGRAETEAPVIAGVVRKFIDALASIGI